jgi:hypothetical protein
MGADLESAQDSYESRRILRHQYWDYGLSNFVIHIMNLVVWFGIIRMHLFNNCFGFVYVCIGGGSNDIRIVC